MAESKKLTESQIKEVAKEAGYSYAALRAIIEVEGSGKGFSDTTGKILIQFEPNWFKRTYRDWSKNQSGWVNNGVGNQTIEWLAFNAAFKISPDAAMKSTSIGLMQIMGFHYTTLGFKTVGEMWDYAKVSEANQLRLGIKFIKSIPALDRALKLLDWAKVAYYYNGSGYKKYKYDTRLKAAYNKFK